MVVSCIDAECKESLTVRNVCPSIIQAHIGFKNSEPFTSESYEQNFDRTMSTRISKSMNQKVEQSYYKHELHNWSVHNIQPKHSCDQAERNAVRRLIWW